ncbi:hypothetical protein ACGYK6_09760 [Sulfitobacter sp. 1A15333]|uniref:hypothetical protein n=1 Tax=unclassified Sulfitobacter TaxID=196795 RepID=UPI0037455D3B
MAALSVTVAVILALRSQAKELIFLAVAVTLTTLALATFQDAPARVLKALQTSGFIAAIFTALATLRAVAESSPAIRQSGQYLAAQPPGRRYVALTLGGHAFTLILNYGSIVLLGSMAVNRDDREPDPRIRALRTKRMLLAVQRGFIAAVIWSPLSLSVAITLALLPGVRWVDIVFPCLVSSFLLFIIGWAMDAHVRPPLKPQVQPQRAPTGAWQALAPLGLLLLILGALLSGLHALTGIRTIGLVVGVVPCIAAVWLWIITRDMRNGLSFRGRAKAYVTQDLPGLSKEILLLMSAGYIGSLGAPIIDPLLASAGVNPAGMPGWAVLLALIWLLPLAGQFGMNPILSFSLIAPLLPSGEATGLSNAAIAAAALAGFALSGASSPFTATNLLTGALGKVSAYEVGMRWSGAYTLLAAALISVWIGVYAFLL